METWKWIPGYKDLYEVSSHGNVRRDGRILRPWRLTGGHLFIALQKNGAIERVLVHRLVLLAFRGKAPPGTEGCHNDGNSENNELANLRWDTRSANVRDRARHDPQSWARGEDASQVKLTEKQVLEIRASPESQRAIAAKYGVRHCTIGNIRRRQSWKHVKETTCKSPA